MCSKACRAGLRFELLAFWGERPVYHTLSGLFCQQLFSSIFKKLMFEFLKYLSCRTAVFQRRVLYYHFEMSFASPFFDFFISKLFCASIVFCLIFQFLYLLIFFIPFFPKYLSFRNISLPENRNIPLPRMPSILKWLSSWNAFRVTYFFVLFRLPCF